MLGTIHSFFIAELLTFFLLLEFLIEKILSFEFKLSYVFHCHIKPLVHPSKCLSVPQQHYVSHIGLVNVGFCSALNPPHLKVHFYKFIYTHHWLFASFHPVGCKRTSTSFLGAEEFGVLRLFIVCGFDNVVDYINHVNFSDFQKIL
eukprot:TRINITY_DN2854_c0_g1_i2.p1 TRINITY_DN2854_c0_g1~~TRINITY_DN2854_c0_g1_i2.p1  ORF type:complete len:146 (+),score=4.52 TRINITY_DN2854_c0_g1_i2:139-576(+)